MSGASSIDREQLLSENERLKRHVAELESLLIPRLISELRTRDEKEQVFQDLLRLSPDSVIPALIVFLRETKFHPSPARQEAIVELGKRKAHDSVPILLSALDDTALCEMAIWALGEIGDAQAIDPLIPFLAYPDPIRRLASEALAKLGQTELVNAVTQFLSGERSDPKQLQQLPRQPIIQALLRDFKSRFSISAIHMLVRMGALEALPELRRWQFMLPDEVKPVCKQAIVDLEELGRLPRPAGGEVIDTDCLPRSAGATPLDTDTLPRSSKGS